MHYFSCAHINKGKAAGTESADCVTEWPRGQAGFLVPPLLTLACERLKLFQIFPLNIYPAPKNPAWKNSRGWISGAGRVWSATNVSGEAQRKIRRTNSQDRMTICFILFGGWGGFDRWIRCTVSIFKMLYLYIYIPVICLDTTVSTVSINTLGGLWEWDECNRINCDKTVFFPHITSHFHTRVDWHCVKCRKAIRNNNVADSTHQLWQQKISI